MNVLVVTVVDIYNHITSSNTGGIIGEVFDNNCGEYGTDYTVIYDEQEATLCTKDGREEDCSTFTDEEFVDAFNKEFPCYYIGLKGESNDC